MAMLRIGNMERICYVVILIFFFSSRRRHTRLQGDWSSDVCSSDLLATLENQAIRIRQGAYLPHWTREGAIYTVNFRLIDSLPQHVLKGWTTERDADRKSTRLNSSHLVISYAVFCLKKKMHWPRARS